jgi:hypothetical protein
MFDLSKVYLTGVESAAETSYKKALTRTANVQADIQQEALDSSIQEKELGNQATQLADQLDTSDPVSYYRKLSTFYANNGRPDLANKYLTQATTSLKDNSDLAEQALDMAKTRYDLIRSQADTVVQALQPVMNDPTKWRTTLDFLGSQGILNEQQISQLGEQEPVPDMIRMYQSMALSLKDRYTLANQRAEMIYTANYRTQTLANDAARTRIEQARLAEEIENNRRQQSTTGTTAIKDIPIESVSSFVSSKLDTGSEPLNTKALDVNKSFLELNSYITSTASNIMRQDRTKTLTIDDAMNQAIMIGASNGYLQLNSNGSIVPLNGEADQVESVYFSRNFVNTLDGKTPKTAIPLTEEVYKKGLDPKKYYIGSNGQIIHTGE